MVRENAEVKRTRKTEERSEARGGVSYLRAKGLLVEHPRKRCGNRGGET